MVFSKEMQLALTYCKVKQGSEAAAFNAFIFIPVFPTQGQGGESHLCQRVTFVSALIPSVLREPCLGLSGAISAREQDFSEIITETEILGKQEGR